MSIDIILASHPIFTQQQKLQEICQPLFKLGLNYFSYARRQQNNKMACLSSCPDFCERYFTSGYFQHDLHQQAFKPGKEVFFWDFVTLDKQTLAMDQDFRHFGRGHVFSIIHATESHQDFYHFAAPLGDSAKNQFYLKNMPLLEKFIYYFHQEIAKNKALLQAFDNQFIIGLQETPYYCTQQYIEEVDLAELKTEKIYLHETQHFITAREFECLHWLNYGKSAEDIACILNISASTIRKHIESIKRKSGCYTAFQLGTLYARIKLPTS